MELLYSRSLLVKLIHHCLSTNGTSGIFSITIITLILECCIISQVTENGKQERHLVATVGKFSVIWNFQQVKDGSHECYQNQVGLKSCYCYKIVPKEDSIVDSRFMHEKFAVSDSPEAPLVVATPMKVSSFSISSSRLKM